MLIPVGYAQVNFVFAGADFPTGAQITLGVENSLRTDPLADQATEIAFLFAAHMAGHWSTEQDNTEVLMKEGPNSTGASVVVPGAGLGTSSDTSDTPAACVLVRKVTSRGGRAGRGRMYWPCPGSSVIDDGGQLTTAYVSSLNGAFSNFRAGLITADHPPVLLHGAANLIPDGIDSFSVQTTLATQRRRQRR